METLKAKRGRKRKIDPRVICGESEFQAAYGISVNTQAEWRSNGLPCYLIGKTHFYFPDEVDAYIKKNMRVIVPQIKT